MSVILKDVSKSFGSESSRISILKNLDLEVQTGEVVAVVGQSGSGKSTLLSLLAGLDRPDRGDLSISGIKYNDLPEIEMTKFRGEKIGIVFQQFHLVKHLTALENVMLPLEMRGLSLSECRERSEQMLNEVKLSHRLEHFPNQMSGGECQRVAIARALVARPSLLLADEPSGNLDSTTGDQVMKNFFDLVRQFNMTTLLVTHNQQLAQQCDRILNLKEGKLWPGVG